MHAKRLWVDTHIHVSDIGPGGTRRERLADDLAAVLDQCDADLRMIASCYDPYPSRMRADPAAILEGNRFIHDLARRLPGRVFGSCTVNPHFLEASLRAMDVCFGEWGFVQLGEMLQYIMSYRMDSDAVERLVRKAVQYQAPVQVHIGTYCRPKTDRMFYPASLGVNPDIADLKPATAGMNHLIDLLGIARRVPEAKLVLGHAIGCGPKPDFIPWANMVLDTLAGVFPSYPDTFWIEIRDFNAPALSRVLREVPVNRLLCGTDWLTHVDPPFPPYGTNFEMAHLPPGERTDSYPPRVESFVRFLRAAGASDADVLRIGAGNARELYRLPSEIPRASAHPPRV